MTSDQAALREPLRPQPHRRGGEAGTAVKQFVTFTIGEEEYGVDIMMVREIKGWSPTTTLPNSPPYVRGVINLRGIIVPIFDLRMRFGMGLNEPGATHVVIIVKIGARTVGLLADGVSAKPFVRLCLPLAPDVHNSLSLQGA